MGLILSGTFQLRSRLSAKALRLYAEQGILEPVHVDPTNRYRYYSEEQLLDARLINMLRAIEMPLASIRTVLSAEGAERAQLIDAYWKRREAQLWGQHNLAAYVISVVSANKETTMTVETRAVPETTYLTEIKRVSPPDIPPFIRSSADRLAELAGRFGGWAGPLTTIIETPVNDDTDGDVRNAVPVRAGVTDADVAPPTEVLVEGAGQEAYTRITKSQVQYPQILQAYDEVYAWLTEHKLTPRLAPREIYFADFMAAGPDDDVCDIAVPYNTEQHNT
ncbi:MerR family transcriptional regulator [Diaminobutyricibacter sp. McL0618]|uniref:MerR family transcriptional regulator n=1 Tax=Leifsonia sp. McL0618 TaxID=3415677 RepID=UPI003CF416F7